MDLRIPRTPEDDAGGPPLDLAAAIREFYSDFPEHKDDVFILNHQAFARGREAVAAIAPQIAALEERHPEAKTGMAKSFALGGFEGKLPMSVNISEGMFNQKVESQIFGRIVIPAGDEFSATLLKSIFVANDHQPNGRFPMMAPEHNNTEMWQRYVLDHELGHAVTMLKMNKQSMKTSSFGNRAECEADAYSMIRHYQRYGAESTFPEYVRDLRNMNAVHKMDVTHWTSRAVQKVIDLNKEDKLKDLTPQQARDLAVKIAEETHLSTDAEYNIGAAFKQIAIELKSDEGTEEIRVAYVLEAAAAVGAQTESPAVLEICKLYMQTIGNYIPAHLLQSKASEQAPAIVENVQTMATKTLEKEPVRTGLGRFLRNLVLDVQSGKGAAAQNDNDKKPPQAPKPPQP
jgi:hypothetical protein